MKFFAPVSLFFELFDLLAYIFELAVQVFNIDELPVNVLTPILFEHLLCLVLKVGCADYKHIFELFVELNGLLRFFEPTYAHST